jgi:hypothetical protein
MPTAVPDQCKFTYSFCQHGKLDTTCFECNTDLPENVLNVKVSEDLIVSVMNCSELFTNPHQKMNGHRMDRRLLIFGSSRMLATTIADHRWEKGEPDHIHRYIIVKFSSTTQYPQDREPTSALNYWQ